MNPGGKGGRLVGETKGPMKVLWVGLSNDRVDVELARALWEDGLALKLIVKPGSRAEAFAISEGVPHVPHVFAHRMHLPSIRLIQRQLSEGSFALVHCFTNRALSNVLCALRGRGSGSAPRLVAYRGTMGHLSRWDPASRLSYLHPGLDRIVCVSDAVRRYLLGLRVPDSRLSVIHKGHDPAWYGDPPVSRADLGIPAGAVVVAFTGNMRPVKGVHVLLRAMQDLASVSSPPIHLLLIGQIRDRRIERLLRHPALAGRVRAVGFRVDAPAAAAAADIFVMPSVAREGLPKAVIEAMAQGIPPIVSRVGGMPELVEDGVSGLVVPPGDPHALAAAIRQLALEESLRRRIGAAALQRIQEDFHIRRTFEKTRALYAELGVPAGGSNRNP